jgi:hypothetical protein
LSPIDIEIEKTSCASRTLGKHRTRWPPASSPAGSILSPAVGASLMSASTIVVALNAELLRRVHIGPETEFQG